MTGADAKPLPALGFLTVVEHPQHGLFGGYLVLNFAGRPLEFHCTAPVKPNRAQQILYGPTLKEYLYGEQIGLTLVSKAKVPAAVVLTDVEPALALRPSIDIPLALLLPQPGPVADDGPRAFDPSDPSPGSQRGVDHLTLLEVGGRQLAVASQFAADRAALASVLQPQAERLDLAEPFQRIRDAIAEAHRAA